MVSILELSIRLCKSNSGLVLSTVAAGLSAWFVHRQLKVKRLSPGNRLVAITGCDSGIGFSTALHCHSRGFYVVAMVLQLDSSGTLQLLQLAETSERMFVIQVDVTNPEQIVRGVEQIKNLLDKDKNLRFHGLMNNAGVMVFGETEWQTERLLSQQLDVNLKAPIRVAQHFAPLLRKYQGRVINVTSQCGKLPLPGLAVYAGSKAGLQAWSDALRIEWAKYGVTVISLSPGAFFQQTNILSRQIQHAQEMKAAMSQETKQFYGDYFDRYNEYLSGLSVEKPACVVTSDKLYNMLDSALLDISPHSHYQDTPWRYSFYLRLANLSPVTLRDRLVIWFTATPAFRK